MILGFSLIQYLLHHLNERRVHQKKQIDTENLIFIVVLLQSPYVKNKHLPIIPALNEICMEDNGVPSFTELSIYPFHAPGTLLM